MSDGSGNDRADRIAPSRRRPLPFPRSDDTVATTVDVVDDPGADPHIEVPEPTVPVAQLTADVTGHVLSSVRPWYAPTALVAFLLVAAIALATCCAAFIAGARTVSARNREASQVLASATSRVPRVLSVDFRTIDQGLDTASANTTGSLKAEFDGAARRALALAAQTNQLVTTCVVRDASLISLDVHRSAVLLMFVDETTSMKTVKPFKSAISARVTMTLTHGSWLISDLQNL